MSRDIEIDIGDGWSVIQYEAINGPAFYITHCDRTYHDTKRDKTCSTCNAGIPDYVRGFVELCRNENIGAS